MSHVEAISDEITVLNPTDNNEMISKQSKSDSRQMKPEIDSSLQSIFVKKGCLQIFLNCILLMLFCFVLIFLDNIDKKIGHGAYGDVFCISDCKNKISAMKIEPDRVASREKGFFEKIMNEDMGKNIVKIYDMFSENGMTFFVMEYCENGSLDDFICLIKQYKHRFIEENV
jgi:hypothetical protein